MNGSALPPTVMFDLDVAESARMRNDEFEKSGGRTILFGFALFAVVQSLSIVGRLHRHHGDDPLDWALLCAEACLFAVMVTSLATRRKWDTWFLRPQRAVTIRFSDTGLQISADGDQGKRRRDVPFAKIRTVRLLPEALLLMGAYRPIVLIPRRALPSEGAQVMAYFEEHLVAKKMLQRPSFRRTTIVNTAYSK